MSIQQSYITAIGTATPVHCIPQATTAVFMEKALGLSTYEARKLRALYRATGINTRYSVLEDYLRTEDFRFFPNQATAPFPDTATRMERYRVEALPLAKAAVADLPAYAQAKLPQVTHLITVSCTGMYAPGLDIELVQALGLATHTHRTCVNFMGCYAAMNALKLADSLCRADAHNLVLVVSVELCTLHLQQSKDDEQLVANAIFGDGAAAVLVERQPSPSGLSLALRGFACGLFPEGAAEMTWSIQNHGFEMRLSSYVPQFLAQGLGHFIEAMVTELGLSPAQTDYFAIHPGGRKILEAVAQALAIRPTQNTAAYEVLRQYGNMSSATMLFVLQHWLQNLGQSEARGRSMLCLAFGPGLTVESARMEFC
ncbi:type III polyketide synthase [Eisenibacter elegans]|uniref:type III polyketide synthase n=1 Tax=Eisenibacter elegans TaxID=997 RepID=UPI000411D559|nr:type III polyketide synthase [Eisenibacter elegans]